MRPHAFGLCLEFLLVQILWYLVKAYLSFNIFSGGNTEDEFCSFFSPQTLQEFTVFEMFIVPWNLMDQLADGLKQMIRMGEAQTDTQGHVIA